MSNKILLKVGDSNSFTKTIGESDVNLYVGILGDFNPLYINESFAKKTEYKARIVPELLPFALADTAAALLQEKKGLKNPAVAYGYEKIEFLKPIFIGDTVTGKYTISEVDEENSKTFATVEVFNQNGELCGIGKHILKFVM